MTGPGRVPRLSDYETRSPRDPAPLVSVVTTVRNLEKLLGRAIASVRAQQIPDLEYIVVDGGSTDGTLDIIRANSDVISFWKSEPDLGISDGFNKGIALATGKYIALLNADDWLSPGQIAQGVECLEQSGADFVFGNLLYHDVGGAPLYLRRGDANYARSIARVMPSLNHPTIIMRRDCYLRCGLFDLKWRYAMDYDLALRFHRAGLRGAYEPRLAGHMTLDGASDRNAAATLREVRDISIAHGHPTIAAYLLFLFRMLKTGIRRLLESLLPLRASVALRHVFNRSLTDAK